MEFYKQFQLCAYDNLCMIIFPFQDIELQTTRSAHKQRLERFKLLKENHDLVLKQLATYEEGSM